MAEGLDSCGFAGHKPGMRRDDLPTSPDQLLNRLQAIDIAYKIYDHPPIFTVAEGEHLKREIPGLHCRNLFLRDKKGLMFLVVAANETKVDLKNLEAILGCARLSFGSAERLFEHLGIYPGAVCPFCVINDKGHQVQVVLDAAMMDVETVCYHPLDNGKTIALSPQDLMQFFAFTGHQPKVIDFSAQPLQFNPQTKEP